MAAPGRTPRLIVALAAALLVAPLGACLDESDPIVRPKLDQRVIPPDGAAPDQGLPSPILELGNIPSVTCGDKVGILGRATPGVNIVVQGGASASGVIGTALPGSGRFCVAVTLNKGQVNHLQVMAHDQTLGFSKPAMVAIQQQDCGGGGGEFKDAGVADAAPPENIAFGVVATSKESPQKGNHGFLTDGKLSTWTLWKGSANWYCGWCDYGGWVKLSFDKLYEVQRVVVHWRDKEGDETEDYGKEYQLLYSAVGEPPDPNLDDGYWTVAKAITEGKGGEKPFDLTGVGSPLMRHIALWLQQDPRPFWQESGTFGTVDESFALAEIEVYTKPKGSGPPPPPPTVCEGF